MEIEKKRAAVLAVAAALLLVAIYQWRPSSTPPAQEPLFTLSPASFGVFEAAFDREPNAPRLVLLLSPT
jgi:hypothetical protein